MTTVPKPIASLIAAAIAGSRASRSCSLRTSLVTSSNPVSRATVSARCSDGSIASVIGRHPAGLKCRSTCLDHPLASGAMAEQRERPEGIAGSPHAGPFPVGAYAAKLRDELRKRARVQLFGEVFGFRAGRARVWFELRDA